MPECNRAIKFHEDERLKWVKTEFRDKFKSWVNFLGDQDIKKECRKIIARQKWFPKVWNNRKTKNCCIVKVLLSEACNDSWAISVNSGWKNTQ